VFNINGKWYTSTNRRLDAFNSKWAARTTTFGIHFADSVRENIRAVNDDEFFEDDEKKLEDKKKDARDYLNNIYEANLDKNKKYMFLLEPCKEERIVCRTNSPRFFNIGVFDKDNNLSLDEDVALDGYEVPKPRELFFKNLREMLNALNNVDFKRIQGFIAIQSEEGCDKHFKLLNDHYKYYFSLRDNTSSIRFRYLQLEHQNTMINLGIGVNQQTTVQTKQMRDDFCAMYNFDPQPLHEYVWVRIVEDLFRKYQQRYIKKMMPDTTLTEKQDKMLKEIHQHFLDSLKHSTRRSTDKIRIMDILAMQKPSTLNQLIAEYEKKDKDAERERRTREM
jgi:hypothetical protein